ncbi:hypothetical protein ACVWW7_000228 [Bradyrhizobium sp. LM6.9]
MLRRVATARTQYGSGKSIVGRLHDLHAHSFNFALIAHYYWVYLVASKVASLLGAFHHVVSGFETLMFIGSESLINIACFGKDISQNSRVNERLAGTLRKIRNWWMRGIPKQRNTAVRPFFREPFRNIERALNNCILRGEAKRP